MFIFPRWPALMASLILATLPPASARAQDTRRLPAGMERVTTVEGITEYKLPNGLRVLLFPDPSKPIVTVNITYMVGSRHEDYGETGMAHLLEHLLFYGTPRHPNIRQELTERASRSNGTTSFDRTNYFETMEATEENLRWALDLEADRMINSFISREDLEKEFSVVRNEYERSENSPHQALFKSMLASMFQWHNYGHTAIGERSDIEGAPIERLQAFYRHYYQPDNAVLLIAGQFEEQKTLDLVQEYFGGIPRPDRKLATTYTVEPTQEGERRVEVRRVGDIQLFGADFRIPGGAHEDTGPLIVLAMVLADEPSGRLYKALVESNKAVRVSGHSTGYAEGGFFRLGVELRPDQSLDEAHRTVLSVIEDVEIHPPTREEVDRAKTRMTKHLELGMKQPDQLGLLLSNCIGMGDWRLAFLMRDYIEKTTPADVSRVARFYLKPANRTLGFFIPEQNPDRVEVPAAPDAGAILKDYQGRPAMAQGEEFDSTPANIEKRTVRGQLPNGMKYALLPKKNRGHAVNATLTLRFGTLESLKGQSTVSELAAGMLERGTTTRTRQQLRETQDKLKAHIQTGGGGASVNASLETDREHLAETIRLVVEMLRQPSFPEQEFASLKQRLLSDNERGRSEPGHLANNTYQRLSSPHYHKDDPRYTRTFEEQEKAIEAVTLEQVKEFHRRFYGASDATVAVVGDFDRAEIEQALRDAFGGWQSPQPYERIRDDYEEAAAGTQMILTPDKANAFYVAGYRFPMRDDDPDYPALTVGGYILGGGRNSRLYSRIRRQEGISYGVRGSFQVSPLDSNADFTAWMIYNPQNLSRLETAFREEIQRAAKDGFTAEELEVAKSGLLNARKVDRSSDAQIASSLSNYLHLGRDLNWDARLEEVLEKLTIDQVNTLMKKHLDDSRMISVKAGDFQQGAKAKAEAPLQ